MSFLDEFEDDFRTFPLLRVIFSKNEVKQTIRSYAVPITVTWVLVEKRPSWVWSLSSWVTSIVYGDMIWIMYVALTTEIWKWDKIVNWINTWKVDDIKIAVDIGWIEDHKKLYLSLQY